jgi:hypothetical protein
MGYDSSKFFEWVTLIARNFTERQFLNNFQLKIATD